MEQLFQSCELEIVIDIFMVLLERTIKITENWLVTIVPMTAMYILIFFHLNLTVYVSVHKMSKEKINLFPVPLKIFRIMLKILVKALLVMYT